MAGLAAYLNFRPEQHWILGLTALITAISVEGTIRSHPDWREGNFGTLSYAFLPLLAVLAAGLFINEVIDGYARVAAGLAAGAATGFLLYAEYHSITPSKPLFAPTRLVLAITTYLAALGLFTVFLAQDLNLPASTAIVGAISFALALDLLRESRSRSTSSLLAALAVGISIGELRVALYYFPLDELLAGALMIIGFYVATGLVHHLLDEDLRPSTITEYVVVSIVSAAAVVFARQLL
ncbi:MAG: hypothetical protein CL897_02605 [Dehalococcoidia bacterium]|nr:hypothetical protein [Dehalococcoidia bacterium]|tara:strand:+ start:271 stop:984 length:714 start_codon:yes stop_codon:yes gene_type:complete